MTLVGRAAYEVYALFEIEGRDRIDDGRAPLLDASKRLDARSSEVSRLPDQDLGELEVAFVLNALRVKFNRWGEAPRGVLRAALFQWKPHPGIGV
ncbi:hypothetical protein [Rhizobium tubonense]|uniref:Uncharacterized protein n=1 Tax=Rhizobium tubonense TaxID=484088 RepID=A0A2W4CIJ9_9HYPH|nr:hypothetical protein [Rhizobium tubonense]PZM10445.1 hypothetical protein CPY51_23035 [Rhizobium tubonense]